MRERFELSLANVYELDYTALFEIVGLTLSESRDATLTTLSPVVLDDCSIFSMIQAGDALVQHPYESFDATVEHFISAAAVTSRSLQKLKNSLRSAAS